MLMVGHDNDLVIDPSAGKQSVCQSPTAHHWRPSTYSAMALWTIVWSLIMVTIVVTVESATTAIPRTVRFAVIAPLKTSKTEESLGAILPSVDLAAKAIAQPNGPLPGWDIVIKYGDGNCSSTDGPLKAFDLHETSGECTMFY